LLLHLPRIKDFCARRQCCPRRFVLVAEMAKYGIRLPPKAMVPKVFVVSLSRVPVSRVPKGLDFNVAVYGPKPKEKLWLEREIWVLLDYWPTQFHKEREVALFYHTDEEPPLKKNMAERIQFWSVPD
jgi:hypothetical protein